MFIPVGMTEETDASNFTVDTSFFICGGLHLHS
jgi:hypothetical protein